MLQNYVLVALQHLLKQKLYTLINVIGLAVGLACFILIGLFLRHELAYDSGWTHADRIYRISRDFLATDVSKAAYLASAPPVLAALMKEDFPEIEQIARLQRFGATLRAADGSLHFERGAGMADSSLFEIFDFEWLRGDPSTALARPQAAVLTRAIAQKYFGTVDALGETLTLADGALVEVTGVIEDLRDDTHLQFSMLMSMPPTPEVWGFNAFHTYALLRPNASADDLREGTPGFFERRFEEGSSQWTRLEIMPVRDIHLHSHKENELRVPGSANAVRTFGAVAVFILVLACINFMNLATARATQRAKEIGVRKVIGAGRAQIVAQFLSESMLVAGIALLFALAIVELALPSFNTFLGTSIEPAYLDNPWAVAGLAALTLGTGFLAGSYPAFYLAAFEPSRVLKGDATRGSGAAVFRRGLVALQFAISIALLIATGIVYSQTRFARDIELGYDKERIVLVAGQLGAQWETLKREWLAHPEITAVTASNLAPGMENTDALSFVAEGAGPETGAGITELWVDYGFFETYGIEVLAGRAFNEQFGTDRALAAGRDAYGSYVRAGSYVINEGVARRYGWTPEQAIGRWLAFASSPESRGPIVGVVRDVYFESIRSAIEPTVYLLPPEGVSPQFPLLQVASLKISGRDLAATLEHIDSTWITFSPDQPVSRRFLDDDFAALYEAELRQGQMFTLFSALAIGIACLGLFGLASFTAERRTKEIGIRKAIGGSVGDIVLMFCGEFGRLVVLANLVAWPVAYLLMQRWLSTFAYRVDMSSWIFVGSALVALALACLTVGAVAAHAASTKPARALRYE